MPKQKPTKTSALAGAIETDIEMLEIETSTTPVPDVHHVQVQKKDDSNLQNTRGKRGQGEYVQLCVHIPKELKKPFRHAVVENDLDNSKMIEKLIRDYLIKNNT